MRKQCVFKFLSVGIDWRIVWGDKKQKKGLFKDCPSCLFWDFDFVLFRWTAKDIL